jgi:hypothetical protein
MAPAVPGWATAQMMPQEKASPPPPQPPPPAPAPDVDAPLNLTKPKGSSPSPVASMGEQPMPATAPKLLPPGLVMPRPFMPYAGLPPHLNHLQPSGILIIAFFSMSKFESLLAFVAEAEQQRRAWLPNKMSLSPASKEDKGFPLHMYLPVPHKDDGKKEAEQDYFGNQCKCAFIF